ncbi:MAG: hypothetical protein GX116_02130 [Fibrobacter sp.]|jgi:hypothetical protein|nr:hypothetical protein [Fibrobacter sp.]
MISFMNFMNKTPLEDEDSDEVKTPEPTRFMSWQDAVFLLVIAALITGGYYYFQNVKKKGLKQFTECNLLFEAKDYLSSEACYEKTWSLSYVTDSMELVRQERLGYITDLRAAQVDVFHLVEISFNQGDSLEAFKSMDKIQKPLLFLEEDFISQWTEWEKAHALWAAIQAAIPNEENPSSTP